MANIPIEIIVTKDANLEYLSELMGGLPVYLEKFLWQRMLQVSHDIVADAQEICPERTGNLKRSIVAILTAEGITIRATVPYWYFVHYGTRHQEAQPFLQFALINNIPAIRQCVVDVIQEYFAKVIA